MVKDGSRFTKIPEMTISFDLDDTLIPALHPFKTEEQTWIHRILKMEKLRYGTLQLFKELRNQKHRIYIYTSSHRSILEVHILFWSLGIPVDKVINQQLHKKSLSDKWSTVSKYPPKFGIDLHIDDSQGLFIEGKKFNFNTLIIDPKDTNWHSRILKHLASNG